MKQLFEKESPSIFFIKLQFQVVQFIYMNIT